MNEIHDLDFNLEMKSTQEMYRKIYKNLPENGSLKCRFLEIYRDHIASIIKGENNDR